jgi:hypothetical protein
MTRTRWRSIVRSRHYRKHFSADPESLIQRFNLDLPELGSAARWKVFIDDPEAMAEAFLNPPDDLRPTAVPAEFVRVIARAFQSNSSAVALEATLTLSFASPLCFEDFIYSLNGGGSSAPAKSGTTYRFLQIAPEAIQREIFAHLQEFWTAATTPDQWKRVLLILIQKNLEKPAMMENFQPIGLLEVLRKVWTKMLIRRILSLLDLHSVLQPN